MYGRFAIFVLLVMALVMPGQVRAHYAYSPNDVSEEDILAYIDRYKDLAIREMYRSGIPASVKLAQAMLESRYGYSRLAREHNNHFGIKCHESWTGGYALQKDDDYNLKKELVESCFRQYASAMDSYKDHTEFLTKRKYYTGLFALPTNDYKAWCQGLQDAGYATNKEYAKLLIAQIERYRLYLFDAMPCPPLLERLSPRPITSGELSDPVYATEPIELDLADEWAADEEPIAMRDEPAQVRQVEAPYVPEAGTAIVVGKADPFAHKQILVLREDSLVANFLGIALWGAKRFAYNGIDAVRVGSADDLESIAATYDLSVAKLAKYNGIAVDEKLKAGGILYLAPKSGRGNLLPAAHMVRGGETVFEIAQKYALDAKDLRRLNGLLAGAEPAAGTVVYLLKSAPEAPRTLLPEEKAAERRGALERLYGVK